MVRRLYHSIKILLGFIYNVYALACAGIFIILLSPFALIALIGNTDYGVNIFYIICRYFARFWLFVIGVRYMEIYSKTTMEASRQQFIYIANHRSYIDIVMMLACMKTAYRPLGKQEMAQIPLFGYFYKRLLITIDRSNLMSRSKGFTFLSRMLERGLSVFIFPEGTFNESEGALKEFYNGPFKLALKSGIKLKPMLFLDDLKRMHYRNIFTIRPGVCRVLFLEEVEVGKYNGDDLAGLKRDVINRMLQGMELA